MKGGLEAKRLFTNPHEVAIDYASRNLVDYCKRNTSKKSTARNRAKAHNPRTKRFVEFDASLKNYKEGIRAIKEDTRNLYRHILLKEERKPILEQESDREDDPQ